MSFVPDRQLPHTIALVVPSAVANSGCPPPTCCSVLLCRCVLFCFAVVQLLIFNHTLSTSAAYGVMHHFWCTGFALIDRAVWRYYIDGEAVASIQFTSSMITGVGFVDTQGPWGNKWIGKGAKTGGWFNNFRIPFYKSIAISGQIDSRPSTTTSRDTPTILPMSTTTSGNNSHTLSSQRHHRHTRLSPLERMTSAQVYVAVRGTENLPTSFNGFTLPSNARLVQQRLENVQFQPLQYVPFITIPSGRGMLFFHTMAVSSPRIEFIEGCYHAYTSNGGNFSAATFPGLIVGTGTEDYFDSAFTFDGGEFHFDVSGFTHFAQPSSIDAVTGTATAGQYELSAYRLHDTDPLFFTDGFSLVWRIGDTLATSAQKCIMYEGGQQVGTPAATNVTGYTFAYVW